VVTAAAVPAAESRLAARMRDQHAAVQALRVRGMGLRGIARELGVDRKTARRFATLSPGMRRWPGRCPGPPCWTATSRTCTAGGTRAATTPPGCAAVTAGLSLPYSSGATEGNVNRLKAIKRQIYGRATLDLLRKRVIHHPA